MDNRQFRPNQIVGGDSLEDRIRHDIDRAARTRESVRKLDGLKSSDTGDTGQRDNTAKVQAHAPKVGIKIR